MLLLKRFIVTMILFIALLIGVPLTILFLRGELHSQKSMGIGVFVSPEVMTGAFIALLVSAAVATWAVRG